MSRITILLFAVSCLAFNCRSAPPKPPPGKADCAAACARADAELYCPAFGPTPNGAACGVWLCESPVSARYLGCVAGAADCGAASECR